MKHFIAGLCKDRESSRKFGLGLMLIAGGFALADWLTVRGHPEQDLPLWPTWIFASLASFGLVLLVASVLSLGPFRAGEGRRRHDDRRRWTGPT